MSKNQVSFFGTGLHAYKEDRRLTLKELSEMTGYSPSYLSEIMKGAKSPDEFVMRKIADGIGEIPENLMVRGRIIEANENGRIYSEFEPLLEQLKQQITLNEIQSNRVHENTLEILDPIAH